MTAATRLHVSLAFLTTGIVGAQLPACRPEPLDLSVGLAGEGEGEGEGEGDSICAALCDKVLGCPDALPEVPDEAPCQALCEASENKLQAPAFRKLVGCLNRTECGELPPIAGGYHKDLLTFCLEGLECAQDVTLVDTVCSRVSTCGLDDTTTESDCQDDPFHQANQCLIPAHRSTLRQCVRGDACDQLVGCLPFGARGLIGCRQVRQFCLTGCADTYIEDFLEDDFDDCLRDCQYGGCPPLDCAEDAFECVTMCWPIDDDGQADQVARTCLQDCFWGLECDGF